MMTENCNLIAKFCYSLDEESYHGQCETIEDAHGQAQDEIDNEEDDGTERSYWVATVCHPIDVYGAEGLANAIANNIEEQLVMWCDEEVGSEEPCLDISKADLEELGKMVVDFFRQRAAIQYYGIKDSVKFSHVAGSAA